MVIEIDYLGKDARKLSCLNYKDDKGNREIGFIIMGLMCRWVRWMPC